MTTTSAQTLFLARHGETGPVLRGRYVGTLDPPLAGRGPWQATLLAERLTGLRPQCCLASPLQRCRQTAAIIAEAVGCPVEVEGDLREIDFGRWEGRSFAEIEASDPDLVRLWAAGLEDFRFPEGEAVAAFNERVRDVLDRIRGRAEERILVVSHGGVIRVMLCLLLGLDPRHGFAFAVEPAGLAVVECWGERGRLVTLDNERG